MIIIAVIVGAVLSLGFILIRRTVGAGAVLFGLIAWYAFAHQLTVPGVVFTLTTVAFLAGRCAGTTGNAETAERRPPLRRAPERWRPDRSAMNTLPLIAAAGE